MRFFEEGGWWLPEGEKHLKEWLLSVDQRVDGRLAYQYKKYEFAMRKVRQHRVAIDVGAHAGLWSYYMARDFTSVFAFEPVSEHRSCWLRNLEGKNNTVLFPAALGETVGKVYLKAPAGHSMKAAVVSKGGAPAEMQTLDSYHFDRVDFLKVDVEGFELFVLKGAIETLRRWKPVVIVEQKKGNNQKKYGVETTEAIAFLKSIGAKVRAEMDGDYVLWWPPKKEGEVVA
jgi:FkbM family methyltransferase